MTNAAYPTGINKAECDFWDANFAINPSNGTIPPPAAAGGASCTPACSGKVCGPNGCGGTCGTCASGTQCTTDQTACLAPSATATVSGFSTCSCLNGTFQLTDNGTGVYSSPAIKGCPGQSQPAYVKFNQNNVSFGIGSATASPGVGNSDYSAGTVTSSSPYQASGNGATSGNINSFCPGVEDASMQWTITKP